MAEARHRPRKRFGQHFLTDPSVLRRIVSAFRPNETDRVVEIGPGLGALTDLLLQHLPHLTAVELDRDLAQRLRERYPRDRLTVIESDVLRFRLEELASTGTGASPYRLIGNLPYNISTPLLFHLMEQLPRIQDMVFMLQREVAHRLSARAGDNHYGRLSVMTALDLDCELLFDVPPGAFNPPPKVDSTVLRLTPRDDPPEVHDRAAFSAVVAAAFAQRRKTLRNSLKSLLDAEQISAAGIDPGLRAEALSVEDFVRLADAVSPPKVL